MMLTSKDKVQRFIILTISPHTLTQPEVSALWDIARWGSVSFYHNVPNPVVPKVDGCGITIPRHVIGTLEHRGILKRRRTRQYTLEPPFDALWYTWDIVWKKTKAFAQLKELRMQHAVGSI